MAELTLRQQVNEERRLHKVATAVDIAFRLTHLERKRALLRAQQTWGLTAWVTFITDGGMQVFIVSAGKTHPSNAYGEGASWDEAFAAAGASLFGKAA